MPLILQFLCGLTVTGTFNVSPGVQREISRAYPTKQPMAKFTDINVKLAGMQHPHRRYPPRLPCNSQCSRERGPLQYCGHRCLSPTVPPRQFRSRLDLHCPWGAVHRDGTVAPLCAKLGLAVADWERRKGIWTSEWVRKQSWERKQS